MRKLPLLCVPAEAVHILRGIVMLPNNSGHGHGGRPSSFARSAHYLFGSSTTFFKIASFSNESAFRFLDSLFIYLFMIPSGPKALQRGVVLRKHRARKCTQISAMRPFHAAAAEETAKSGGDRSPLTDPFHSVRCAQLPLC